MTEKQMLQKIMVCINQIYSAVNERVQSIEDEEAKKAMLASTPASVPAMRLEGGDLYVIQPPAYNTPVRCVRCSYCRYFSFVSNKCGVDGSTRSPDSRCPSFKSNLYSTNEDEKK